MTAELNKRIAKVLGWTRYLLYGLSALNFIIALYYLVTGQINKVGEPAQWMLLWYLFGLVRSIM